MTNGEKLGNALYELRKKSGMSQEELAERLGVSRQAVSKWECGESLPDTDNLITIAKLYGVSLDELVGNVPAESAEKGSPADTQKQEEGDKDAQRKDGQDCQDCQDDGYFDGREDECQDEDNEDGEDNEEEDEEDEKAVNKSPWLRVLYALPYPIVVTVAFLCWGFACGEWDIAWVLYVTVPLYYTLLDCFKTKRVSAFAYPVLVAFIYLFCGMKWGIWHPSWVIFLTIPIFYGIAGGIDKR